MLISLQEQLNLKYIADAPNDKADPRKAVDKERQKALRKRCKKLRQRMSQRSVVYVTHSLPFPTPILEVIVNCFHYLCAYLL